MSLPKRYESRGIEPNLETLWQEHGVYHYNPDSDQPVYSIDTPPPTVSGHLHLGHVYSYSHADFIARFWRMKGYNVFYPMGYDDNGLPTERLVEKSQGITAHQVGRRAFIEKCLEMSDAEEKEYQALWKRLGLSIDWRYTYRTIDETSRRTSQLSFIDLYRKGLVYRREAPVIWCPECHTAIAQADLNDLDRQSEFVTLAFSLDNGQNLAIATTRPELLPACVAVFVHPDDDRYRGIIGKRVTVPIFRKSVPILADKEADPHKGTGAVMCCTFGDTSDISWWRTYQLPFVEAIGRDGCMTQAAGIIAGLTMKEARHQIIQSLDEQGLLLGRQPTTQSIRVHERCDTPVEYIIARQWFTRVIEFKNELLKVGEGTNWHPEHMLARYRAWVENLNWDWCISRQRYYGVTFPVWYCKECGEITLAEEDQLPVDPSDHQPIHPCPNCGGQTFIPDEDIMDTWATSSLTPQIVGRWLDDPALYARVFPFKLRPQAHEIIRTWAFYTIVKSYFHFAAVPWENVLISGWGIAGEGMGKISKSRGGGPMSPLEMIERYSADAVRYWAASTGPGKDTIISEEKIQLGARLVTKLWNVARFSERFLFDFPPALPTDSLSPADLWILSRLNKLIRRVTELFENYDYAMAKSDIEAFFWTELADNYLEMCKQRLYDSDSSGNEGARHTLHTVLLTVIKLFAPFLPHITEEIYQSLFENRKSNVEKKDRYFKSIHTSSWPVPDPTLENDRFEATGEILVAIATAVRRYKSEHNWALSTELNRIQLVVNDPGLAQSLEDAILDLSSITRAKTLDINNQLNPNLETIFSDDHITVAIEP